MPTTSIGLAVISIVMTHPHHRQTHRLFSSILHPPPYQPAELDKPSYNFHGLMMGMLLGTKSISFLVARVKLWVYVVAAIKLSIVDIGVPAFSAFP